MKTKNVNLLKGLYSTNVNNGQVLLVGNYAYYKDVVSMSSQNGDHRHPNPFSYSTKETNHYPVAPYEVFAREGNWGGNFLGGIYAYWTGPLADSASLINVPANDNRSACYNKALGRLNEKMRGSLDISVDLAESAQARRMLTEVGKFERWFSGIGVKRWANEWLQLKYGWQPLLSSVYGAANELLEHAEVLSHARGSATISETRKGIQTRVFDVSGVGDTTCHPVNIVSSTKLKNACLIDVTVGPPSSLTAASRWTSLNPLSIAWELTPYSFVVDWFFDVGSYLRDAETAYLYNSRFRGGFKSELFLYDTTGEVNFDHSNERIFSAAVVKVKAKSTEKARMFSRTLLTSYPCPHLPRVETDLSWNRLITAAALVAQKVDKKLAVKLGLIEYRR